MGYEVLLNGIAALTETSEGLKTPKLASILILDSPVFQK